MDEEKTLSQVPAELEANVASYLKNQPSVSPVGNVRFDDLTVEGAGRGVAEAQTVPTAFANVLKTFEPTQYFRHVAGASRILLDRFSGSIRPGEMVLVISKPGGGCSTFLKSLAGMRGQFKSTIGRLTYGGSTLSEVMKQHPGCLAYCGEQDMHFGTLTVETTLRFAIESRTALGVGSRKEKIDQDVSAIAALFGLAGTLKTPVDRISGGQRRRMSLAEAFITNADLLCLDNPTAGLDSSTALRLVQMLRAYVDQRRSACVMAAYQAADSLCAHFDKVMVINRGRLIYFGPTQGAIPYFEGLGFQRPAGTTLADFLTIMSGEPQSWPTREGHMSYIPHTADDLARLFRQSALFVPKESDSDEATSTTSPATAHPSEYALPVWRQVYLCTVRQFRILISDRSAWMTESIATVLQALVIGTIFFNEKQNTQSLYSIGSAMFLSVLTVALRAAAELRVTFSQRPLLLKQKHLRFYRPGSYAIGQILSDVPWKVLSVIYNIPLYFMVHFQWEAGHFFIWFLSLYLAFQATSLMFRAIAVFTVSPDKAALPVGLWLNVLIIYTGFYIPIPQMKVWLGWLRFLDPMYYAYETMMINQFWDLDYSCSASAVAPSGSGYGNEQHQTCAIAGSAPGSLTIAGRSYVQTEFNFQYRHLWRNVGINAGFFVFFSICVAVGMERFKPAAGRLATVFYKPGFLNTAPPKPVKNDIESQDDKSAPQSQTDVALHTKGESSGTVGFADLENSGHVFAWKDICLDTQTDGESKRLLANVSGWTKPGLTALMGGSGAGKSTLMNALAQRPSPGPVSGDFFLDGQPLQSSIKRRIGYVYQQDVHLPTSTVREALQFAARLRQGSSDSVASKYAYVESIIQLLEMEDIADALIGAPGAGLSLEKRKRASIGVELAARPDAVLFLDEPTSGLDSDSALAIIRILRKVADAGQAVLCIIHQPATQLITQFDSLLVLVPGGRTAYFGSMGSQCQTAISYFAQHSRPLVPDENPAEFFIDVVGSSSTSGAEWPQIWLESPEAAQAEAELSRLITAPVSSTSTSTDQADKVASRSFAASYLEQYMVVQQRAFRNYWREPTYAVSKLLMLLFNALLNGLTFLQLPLTVSDARSRVFTMFVASITAPPQMVQLEPRLVAFRNIFLARDRGSGSYHWSVFLLAAVVVELPYAFAGATIYWILWYYTVGLPFASARAAYAWFMYLLYTLFYTALGQGIASMMPTLTSALLITPFIFLILNTFAGPLSPPPVTPAGWHWFFTVSPQYYLVDGMESDFLHAKPLSCTARDISTFASPPHSTCAEYAGPWLANATGFLQNPQATADCQYCPYANGDQYLQQYDFSWAHRGRDVGAYVGFLALNWSLMALGTYLLFIKSWRRRRV